MGNHLADSNGLYWDKLQKHPPAPFQVCKQSQLEHPDIAGPLSFTLYYFVSLFFWIHILAALTVSSEMTQYIEKPLQRLAYRNLCKFPSIQFFEEGSQYPRWETFSKSSVWSTLYWFACSLNFVLFTMQGDVARKHIEFSVVQVSCASRKWILQPLSHNKTGTFHFLFCPFVLRLLTSNFQKRKKRMISYSPVPSPGARDSKRE